MLKAEKKCKVSGEDGDDAEEEESQAGTKTRVRDGGRAEEFFANQGCHGAVQVCMGRSVRYHR